MKPVVTWLAIFLLIFSSGIAFYAGYHLVGHPDGSTIRLATDTLKDTPFKNFKIPGILFFITVGIIGLITIILTLFQQQFHTKFIIAVSIILVMWSFLLMAFTPETTQMHYVLLFAGILQVLCGLWLDKKLESAA